jgi:predicted O-methyltransferase YrrM
MTIEPPTLQRMFTDRRPAGRGTDIRLDFNIPISYCHAIQRCVAARPVAQALEIGMAYGVSSLAILGARNDVRLTSIDPFQQDHYGARGRMAVEEAGFADRHELVQGFDYTELPRLLSTGLRVQFAYVDGYHTFDHTLLDFYYVNRMLSLGGVVAFNDCAMPAVHRVCRFVTSHYDYREIDVGLSRTFTGISRLSTVQRRLQGRQHEDRYFEKLSEAEPAWNFYAPF